MGQLTQCCFCLSLKIGTVVIGVLDLIAAVIYLAAYSFLVSQPMIRSWWIVFVICLLVYCIFRIIFDCLLIYGASQLKVAYTVPWMVFNIVMLVLSVFGAVAVVIYTRTTTHPEMMSDSVNSLFKGLMMYLLALAWNIYLIKVVYSFYKSIEH